MKINYENEQHSAQDSEERALAKKKQPLALHQRRDQSELIVPQVSLYR